MNDCVFNVQLCSDGVDTVIGPQVLDSKDLTNISTSLLFPYQVYVGGLHAAAAPCDSDYLFLHHVLLFSSDRSHMTPHRSRISD